MFQILLASVGIMEYRLVCLSYPDIENRDNLGGELFLPHLKTWIWNRVIYIEILFLNICIKYSSLVIGRIWWHLDC